MLCNRRYCWSSQGPEMSMGQQNFMNSDRINIPKYFRETYILIQYKRSFNTGTKALHYILTSTELRAYTSLRRDLTVTKIALYTTLLKITLWIAEVTTFIKHNQRSCISKQHHHCVEACHVTTTLPWSKMVAITLPVSIFHWLRASYNVSRSSLFLHQF